jgi:hypothetical protein
MNVRSVAWRPCSAHASSLGLHPALYFYSASGDFQLAAFLSFLALFRDYDTNAFKEFTAVTDKFEEFLMSSRGATEAIRRLGSGSRGRSRVLSLYKLIIKELSERETVSEVHSLPQSDPNYSFLFADITPAENGDKPFRRRTKGAAYLRDAMPTALKCATCGGIMHCNGTRTGHLAHRRDGGASDVENAIMQHPFCNSTARQ